MKHTIKELRQQGRDPQWCLAVTPGDFDAIVGLLKSNYRTLKERDVLELLATIANIVLVNRELHAHHFTPNCSGDMLSILTELVDASIHSQRMMPLDRRYFNRVAMYRLLFLILYDSHKEKGKGTIDPALIVRAHTSLVGAFRFLCVNYDQHSHQEDFQLTCVEVVKALYSLYHNYDEEERCGPAGGTASGATSTTAARIDARDCIASVNKILKQKRSQSDAGRHGAALFTDTELTLTKSLLNFHMAINTTPPDPLLDLHDLKNQEALFYNLVFFLDIQLRAYKPSSMDDFELDFSSVSSRFGVASTTAGTAGTAPLPSPPVQPTKPNAQKVTLVDLLAILVLFHQGYKFVYEKILSCEQAGSDCEFYHELIRLRSIYWDYFIPSASNPTHNYLYNQLFRLSTLTSAHGSVAPSEVTYAAHLKNIILEGYFRLGRPTKAEASTVAEQDRRQTELILELFGYNNCIVLLMSNGLEPTPEMCAKYMNPTCKYLDPAVWSSEPRPPLRPASVSHTSSSDIVDTLFKRKGYASTATPRPSVADIQAEDEMTPEEKEIEAEKLFTLLNRVEKNPAFEGFVNPVREWQQSGKFEHIS